MTRILINGRFLTRRATGVDRFAHELLNALDRMIGVGHAAVRDFQFEVLLPPDFPAQHQAFEHIPCRIVGRFHDTLWEQIDLPFLCGDDLLVNLCNSAPLLRRKQVVVIHDAAPRQVPEAYGRAFRLWYRFMAPWLGRWSKAVFTVSEFSRRSLARAYGLNARRITVLSESGEHILRTPADRSILARKGLERAFVLAVGSLSPHKNFRLVVEAINLLPDAEFDLVVAGGADPRIFSGATASLPDSVRHVGYVSDEELRALYESASCFVFPSLYEGFGLPPLEAMSLGCPVISSDAASLPEVCGDAAIYIAPDDAQALARELLRVMGSADLRQQMQEAGREQARSFTWDGAAELFVNALADVCSAKGRATVALKERAA